LKSKHFISVADLDREEINALITGAIKLKAGGWKNLLREKVLALIFEKPSLRTRVSFDIAMRQLGGHCIYLSPEEVGLGKRESVPDVARVLGRYADVIAARTFSQRTVEILAEYSGIPVINALSDAEHPCQALADILTIYEKKGKLKGLTLAFIGDGNNVAHSLLLAASITGMNISLASPAGYRVQDKILQLARSRAAGSGAQINLTGSPEQAAAGADIVYTDVWVSMGQEAEAEQRRRVFAPYQITEKLLSKAKKDALLMHPLPAHHGEEVAENILYCPQSVVFDQAENRLHFQKALLAEMLGKPGKPA